MSSQSEGSSRMGVEIGLAGLSFQVITLLLFIVLAAQYALRYYRSAKTVDEVTKGLDGRWRLFLPMLGLATLAIVIRCVFRMYEQKDGYHGTAIHNEGISIGLESWQVP